MLPADIEQRLDAGAVETLVPDTLESIIDTLISGTWNATSESPLESNSSAQLVRISSEEDFFSTAYDWGWTDGLPVIAPTSERVERFIAASGLDASVVIAQVDPRHGDATVERVAANAVMAGCKPEYMTLLIAALQAVCDPSFNLGGVQTTTNPVAPVLIVNGPIRHSLEINAGRNALGPGVRSNATIGRALRLVLLNIGGATPGEVDKATLGMPGKYTFCFAEYEEDSPWEPLSVVRGFSVGTSTVTAVAGQGTSNILPGEWNVDSIIWQLADCISVLGSNSYVFGMGHPLVILPPGHAQLLDRHGWTRQKLAERLFELSAKNLGDIPPIDHLFPSHSRHVKEGKLYCTSDPSDILIVVAGGPEPYHITYVANFGDSSAVTKAL